MYIAIYVALCFVSELDILYATSQTLIEFNFHFTQLMQLLNSSLLLEFDTRKESLAANWHCEVGS